VSFSSKKTPDVFSAERAYPGTCRHLGLPLDAPNAGWRVRLPAVTVTFEDRWCGPQTQTPAEQCGDLLIRDRLGNWTYQFVATVDDHLQSVTDVIRGLDLLPSTGRQILLSRLIGRATPPAFAHHALIMKSAAQKLSKSDRDTGVRDLRAAGWTREQVLAAARSSLGL
jgi:glutamyl-Q tRNA(Asp) synthetase